MLHLNLVGVSVSKMYPEIIASLLYPIMVYERAHRNTLLSDSRGNLYLYSTWGLDT